MKICHCALPAITGNSNCCKNCPNNQSNKFVLPTINNNQDIMETTHLLNDYEFKIKQFKELLLDFIHKPQIIN